MSGERKTTNERLEELQTADSYDSISVTGQSADWIEVLAVFAVKVAGSNDADAADVATMDADRIARLKAVFWDMTAIRSRRWTSYWNSGRFCWSCWRMCTPSAGTRRQAAPPPALTAPTGWIAVDSSIGCSTMPRADSTSSVMAEEPRCSTTIALIFRGQTHSPVTWCSTRIIPMWASLAAGTQTENC